MKERAAISRREKDRSRRSADSRRAGFTLVEALVAFAILAVLTLVVQRAVGSALHGTAQAQDRVLSENVVRTLLTAPLGNGANGLQRQSGQLGGYGWTMDFDTTGMQATTRSVSDGKPVLWRPARVIISVTRKDGRALVVETIRLIKTGSP